MSAELIPLLDAVLTHLRPRLRPHRHTPEELETMLGQLEWLVARYGAHHRLTRWALLILGLEMARSEVVR